MIQNFIFDLYGTLADIRTDEESDKLWEKVSEIYKERGAVYQPEELKSEFRRLEDALAESAGEDREPDLMEVFALLYTNKGVSCDSVLIKRTAAVFRSRSREFIRLYDGVEELLQELGKRGKGIYLLSNAQAEFTRPEIEMLGLNRYFDGILLSSEEGYKKPSPVFFKRLLQRYRLEPSECMMIGNDAKSDIAGARRMGIASLYIHTDISPELLGKVDADYCVMDGDFKKIAPLILD